MDEDFNPDIYTLIDEDGIEQAFELLDVMEYEDERYFALIPYFETEDDTINDDGELIILKSQMDENDDELMISIDDDDEYQKIGNIFIEKLSALFEEEVLDD